MTRSMDKKNWKFVGTPFWLILFWVLAAALPFSVALNPTSNIDLALVRVLALLIFLLWLLWSLANRQIDFDKRARFWLLLLFLAISALSFFWSVDSFRAGRKILFLFSFLPVYFAAFSTTKNTAWRLILLKIFAWSGLFLAIFGLILFSFQFIFGIDSALKIFSSYTAPLFLGNVFSEAVTAFPSWMVNISGTTIIRTFGSFPDPHLFALYLNMLLPLVGFLYFKSEKKQRIKYLIIFLIILLASLLSFSRAAYLSLIVGAIFLFFVSRPDRIIKKYPLASSIILFVFILIFIIPNPLISRFSSSLNFHEGSNQGRILMWQKASEITGENSLLGVGLGNFPRIIEPESDYRDPIYAHNLFLDFSSETGLINMLILLALVISPVVAYFKKPSLLTKALAISFVIFFIHSLFETPFYSVRVFPLFLILIAFQTDEKSN